MKYKVYEIEEKVTATGKEMKKLVLQGEGKQYPDKGVTMWSDHPLFTTIASGQTIEAEIQVTDSKTPNPHGGFYKNKVLLKESGVGSKVAVGGSSGRVENLLEFEIKPLLYKILAWQDRRDKLDGIEDGASKEDDVMAGNIPF